MPDFRDRVLEGLPGIRRPFLGEDGTIVGPGEGEFGRNYIAVWIRRNGPTVSTYYEWFRLRHDEQLALDDQGFIAEITAGIDPIEDDDEARVANKVAERFLTMTNIE